MKDFLRRRQQFRHRPIGALSAVVLLGTATLAVTTTSAASSARPRASSSTWVIGNICTCTGEASSIFAPSKGDLSAWQRWINASGGINGHKVVIDVLDDQNTPSIGLSDAQKLVQGDHIVALVGSEDNSSFAWASYLTAQHIPVIGGGGSTEQGFIGAGNNIDNTDFYPPGSAGHGASLLEYRVAKLRGATKIGEIYCAEYAGCASGVANAKLAAAAEGETYVLAEPVSATAPSYVAPCIAMKQAGAQAVVMAIANATIAQVADTCYQQGFKPVYLGGAASITPNWATDPAFANSAGTLDEFPWWNTKVPAIATFNSVMRKYDPAGMQSPTTAGEVWASLSLFGRAAKLAKSTTSAALQHSLNTFSHVTLGGLVPSITYTNGARDNPCGYLFEIGHKKFNLLNNGKLACG